MNATKRLIALAGSILAVSACSDGSGPPKPSSLAINGALPQAAAVGSVVAPSVLVKDAGGRPVSGVTVTFAVTGGGGTVSVASATTNTSGVASAGSWTLGTTLGANTLVASSGSLTPITFNVNAVAGAPATVTPLAGNVATAIPGVALDPPPGVRVTDQYSNPVAGAEVLFSVSSSANGTVSGIAQQTDVAGVARPGSWTLGISGGVQTLTARVGTLSANLNVEVTIPSAMISAFAGNNTTCPVGMASCTLTASVITNTQQPGAGQSVQWLSGTNGSLLGTTTTNLRGFTSFTVPASGATGGGTVKARLESTGQEITYSYSVVQGGQFDIDARFIGNATPSQQAVFEQAAARWEQIITGDLPDVNIAPGTITAGECGGVNHPELSGLIDDLVIFIEVVPIDTVGKVLGQAGFCRYRTSSQLPVYGIMKLDQWDVANMENSGRLYDVVLHEMGHVLGLGSSMYSLRGLRNPDTSPARYDGPRAYSGFVLAGGTLSNGVPLEDCVVAPVGCGQGTIYSHWREFTFGNELMTGYISPVSNPLSSVTIGALMDLGYQVDFGRADAYCLTGWSGYPSCFQGGGVSFMQMVAPDARDELVELPMPAPRPLPGT